MRAVIFWTIGVRSIMAEPQASDEKILSARGRARRAVRSLISCGSAAV
jgi:hypothetical protein